MKKHITRIWDPFHNSIFYHEEREGHEEKQLQELQVLHGDYYQNSVKWSEISILNCKLNDR